MFAIAALVTFLLAFLLELFGADTGKGLSFLAAAMVFGGWNPLRRG